MFPLKDHIISHHVPNATDATNQILFTAPFTLEVVDVKLRFRVNCASGTIDLVKSASAVAVSAGTTLLATAASLLLSGTADTNVVAALSNSIGGRQVPKGSSIGLIFAGTLTNLVDLDITIVCRQVKKDQ